MLGGNPGMDKYPIQGGVEIQYMYSYMQRPDAAETRDKRLPDRPLGSYADFTVYLYPLLFR